MVSREKMFLISYTITIIRFNEYVWHCPEAVALKMYYKFDCFNKLNELEEKLENKQISEGEYLETANKIKINMI